MVSSRILRALFVLYVAVTVAHIGWVVAHEPFVFDAWNVAVDTHAKPATVGHFFEYWRFEYTHSNPRIGQALTYLTYKLEYFAVIATPLAYLAISLAVTVLGLGRWPRKGKDLALWALAIGFPWFALPQIGKMLFCRAYCANYIYGAAMVLWFLVPLRLGHATRRDPLAVAAYALLGLCAGLANEHTGPALCAFMVAYAWWRRADRPVLVWAGAAGAIVGFLALFFAPGQGERYEGLAQQVSLVGRVLQRGFVGNLDIVQDLVLASAPLAGLYLVTIVLRRDGDDLRGPRRLVALAIVAAVVMTLTIFPSPKLGPRFFYVSMLLLLAGYLAVADVVMTTPRRLAPLVVLAVFASGYAIARTVPLYGRLARQSAQRMAALEATKPGSVFVADALDQVDETWWCLGDDFRDLKKRELVAKYFDLEAVRFRSPDPNAPLGVNGARLVAKIRTEPASCVDDHGGFGLATNRGFDLAALHKEIDISIGLLRRRLGATRLDQLDLEVELDDPGAALPRRLLAARWTPTGLFAPVGAILRKGLSTTRRVSVPKELADREIYIYQVGGELRRLDAEHTYIPWRSGVYWALACDAKECFVFAAAKQGG
jgi:hypothetical protein